MSEVYLSIGSNVDRDRRLREARRALAARFGGLVLSSVYESRAVGFVGDDFYNLVVGLETDLPVRRLLDALKDIEAACGRRRGSRRFAPRTMDIDLLLYGDRVVDEADLRLPRDEIDRHAFVLAPLAEIAGQRRHPVTGRTFGELWAAFPGDRDSLRIVDFDWGRG